ncbi:MAG: glycosyltransferase family 39 protein [Chromatiaceae bacterium]|nr:glycosyltransferase family 39 protein [Chromatiaceae bacterium]
MHVDSAGRVSRVLEYFLASRAAIVLAVAIAVVWGFWAAPLVDLDEGAFTEATREMIASGNYVSIYLNGEPRNDKPILIYWLQAASVHAFGLNEFALRLPSVIAGLAWLWVLYRFARRHTDQATASVAVLLMALSVYVGVMAKAATADALLNLFLALAMFDIYNHSQRPSPALLRRIFVWIGLGFLTKGPVAVVFPFLVSGLFYASYGRWREWLRLVFDPLGLLIFVAIVLPWHVALYLDSGWVFFEGFYLGHNVDRYSRPMEGHGGGILYYALVAPLIVMPFAGWFLSNLGGLRQAATQPLDRYIWLWFFSVLLVFSFSGTKLPHYLLYGMSGLFVLMARNREGLRNPWLAFVPAALLFGLFAILAQMFAVLAAGTSRVYEKSLFESAAQAFSGWPQVLIVLGVLTLPLIISLRLSVWRRLLLIGIAQAAVVAGVIAPTVVGVLQAGPKAAGLFAREHAKELVYYRTFQPSVSVYRQQVIRRQPAVPGQWAYVRVDHVDEFLGAPSPYQKRIVFSQVPATLIAVEQETGQ